MRIDRRMKAPRGLCGRLCDPTPLLDALGLDAHVSWRWMSPLASG